VVLRGPVETYRAFGVQAEYRSINDIITKEGKRLPVKGRNIGDCMVFVVGFFSILTIRR
jgi:hypothetical protein